MYPLRRSLLPVILAGALFAPAAHAAQTPGSGPGHGSVFQLATLPTRTRPRRRLQSAKVRASAWWRRRAPGAATTGRPADAHVRPQLSTNDTSARGPPRFR
jgi:hypothetical protein